MSFEDHVLGKIDRERRGRQQETMRGPSFERAHEHARELFRDPSFSIQAPNFIDLYGKENVLADMQRVKERQRRIAASESPESKEMKRVAEVFEAITLDQSNTGGWLGERVGVLKTSLYDDYFNGTDMLAEWEIPESESQVLALSVDVTFSTLKMSQKIGRIKEDVEKGKLGSVKYFKSKDGSFRGERRGIPQVVIGVDRDTVFKLADLWIKGDTASLKDHPAQRVLLDEIAQQLGTIQSFASARGQKVAANSYARSLSIVREIQKQKEHTPLGDFGNDRVYQGILEETERAFGH